MRLFAMISILVLAAGCKGSGDSAEGKPGAGGAAVPAGEAAPVKGGGAQALTPLPLTIKVKPGGKGVRDLSRGDTKSVTVDIGDGASLNIQPAKASLADMKKKLEKDMMYPFKKWEKESDNSAVLLFENDGKPGYRGLAVQDVGGTKYVCKTTGMDGVKSVALAEAHLAVCKTLAAK